MQLLQQISARKRGSFPFFQCFIAVLTVVVAILITDLTTTIKDRSPYMMFYAAVTVSAWYGGLLPGILATILSALAGNFFFISPTYSIDFSWSDFVHMGLFTQVSLLISSLNAARRKNLEILLAAQELFQSFMDNSPTLAYIKDEAGRYIFFNRTLGELLSQFQGDLLGKSDFDIWPLEVAEQFSRHDEFARRAGKTTEVIEEVVLPDGKRFWISFRFTLKDSSGRSLLAGVSIDITERRKIEHALDETMDELRKTKIEWELTVNSFPEIIFLVRDDQQIIRANQSIEKWGLGTIDTVSGKSFHEVMHVDCRSRSCYLNSIFVGALAQQDEPYFYQEVQDEILQRRLAITIRPIKYHSSDLKAELEKHFVIILRDITRLHALQQSTKRRERFETMEYLVGRLAHQLGNPLAALKTTAQVWLRNFDRLSAEKQLDFLTKITDRINYLQSITENILNGQGWRIKTDELISVRKLFKRGQELFEDEIREKSLHFIVVEPQDPDLTIIGNARAVDEVIANLLRNAIEACRPGDKIMLESAVKDDKTVIMIRDMGCGIDQENIDNLFTPFFSTKKFGSGIGLAHSNFIMEELGGHVEIDSMVGKGTTVTLIFNQSRSAGEQNS